ncbi:MAG: helix-turn-helix transcriptional regulator [Candidatus Nitrotoga sp.]
MTEINSKQSIGTRIKQARTALGLTQKGLCEKTGMKLPSLRDYELGNSIPGGEAIADLMRAEISANWVLTGEGEMLLSAGEDEAEALLSPSPDGRLLMLQMVVHMSEMQLKEPPTPDVAKKVIDMVDGWMTFAAKYPDLKERLVALKVTAALFV